MLNDVRIVIVVLRTFVNMSDCRQG